MDVAVRAYQQAELAADIAGLKAWREQTEKDPGAATSVGDRQRIDLTKGWAATYKPNAIRFTTCVPQEAS
jgi:hypothetical protein